MCTDVETRGIDIQLLPFVINVTITAKNKNYMRSNCCVRDA